MKHAIGFVLGVDEWFDDYARFLALFGATARLSAVERVEERPDGVALYLGWVRGEKTFLEM